MATWTILASACAVLLLCGAAHSQQSCPSGWHSFNKRCFKIVSTPTTFHKAEGACQKENAHLASIHSHAQNSFMRALVRGAKLEKQGAWIGGAEDVSEGQWYWLDGSAFNYKDWAKGQPDNYGNNEDCLGLFPKDQLRWNDWNCGIQRPYICLKKHANGTDELKMTDASCAP